MMIQPQNARDKLERIIEIAHNKPTDNELRELVELARDLRSIDAVSAHFEQREANSQVRRLREDLRCPTCGAETDGDLRRW